MYTITLADGTKLKNLELNGNNYIAKEVIDDSVFAGNLAAVTITDGKSTESYTDMVLISNRVENGHSWFILGEPNLQEKAIEDGLALASLMFVLEAQSEDSRLDDETLSEHADVFPIWDEYWRGKRGDIVRDEGKLFRSIHDVNDAGQNRKPSATPSMWTPIGNPGEEWPEWSQPLGGHDAYMSGDKVAYDGKHWISTADNNVWQPGVYGWEEVSTAN